jgi:hypothetical protein
MLTSLSSDLRTLVAEMVGPNSAVLRACCRCLRSLAAWPFSHGARLTLLQRRGITVAGAESLMRSHVEARPDHVEARPDLPYFVAAFRCACGTGNVQMMDWLQATCKIPNPIIAKALPEFACTACQNGRDGVLAKLLTSHPDPSAYGPCKECRGWCKLACAQKFACRGGHYAAAEVLSKRGVAPQLADIAIGGNVELMKRHIKTSPLIFQHGLQRLACLGGHSKLAVYLARIAARPPNLHTRQMFIHCICLRGELDMLIWAVERYGLGVDDLRSRGDFPFIVACDGGHLELAKWLVARAGPGLLASAGLVVGLLAWLPAPTDGQREVIAWLGPGPALLKTDKSQEYVFYKASLNSMGLIPLW